MFVIGLIVWSMLFIALGVYPFLAVILGLIVTLFFLGPLTWFLDWVADSIADYNYVRKHK